MIKIEYELQNVRLKMLGEREWIARCCSLAQTERDILRQLANSFDRLGDCLTREERDQLAGSSAVFKPADRSFIQQFHQTSTLITNIRPHDRGFKTRLDKLEKEIMDLRVSSAADLEKANVNLRRIQDDIEKRERRFTALQTPAIRPKPRQPVQFESPISEFQTYLARNGGRTGGWDTASHTEFLRQLQKHGESDLPSFLPNIPRESVLAHIEWYNEFERLKQRMKAALNEMREETKRNKENQIAEAEPQSPKVDPEVVKQRIQERERMRLQREQDAAKAAAEHKKAQEKAKRQKFAQLKHELMRRQADKPSPIKEVPVAEVKPEPRRVVVKQEDLDRIRRRENAAQERKNAIKQAQEAAQREREEKVRKIAEKEARKFRHAKRDPERLMQPTAAMRARKEAKDTEPKGPVNSVFMIPHRATPAWML